MAMMMLSLLLVCVFLQMTSVYGGGGGTYGGVWNYHESSGHGPSTWKNSPKNAACGLHSQSPINIQSSDAQVKTSLGSLKLSNYDVTTNVTFLMHNRDTDIEFKAEASSGNVKDIPQTVTFDGTTYRLYQLHFHWGLVSHQGSEHQLDSQQYAAEMHIIHYNDKYASVNQAINETDGLLVWGHFLQVTSKTRIANSYAKNFLTGFADVQRGGQNKSVELNLKKLLPEKRDTFYHYAGSLTTPPCFESVKWIVNPNPLQVSEELMSGQFRTLIDDPMTDILNTTVQMGDNYRPIQALGGRTVFANFDPKAAPLCNAAVGMNVHMGGIIGSLIMALYYALM
jgi:carbonic anhydrase